MNALAALLVLAGACLAGVVALELRSSSDPSEPAIVPRARVAAAPAAPAAPEPSRAPLIDMLLARPLFSETRRPPETAGPAASAPTQAAALPRMTAILIDGPRRRAIFAAPATSGGKPVVVAEGGHIGPFTVQSIEPQQVVVTGPDGRRTIRTSFDPMLQPPMAPPPPSLGAPQFPGISPGPAAAGGTPLIAQPPPPSAGYAIPQSAGAAR